MKVLILGGGVIGTTSAYYLAREHGITNVAVLEKSYIGSGNVGRNTTIIRSNYLLPANTHFYEKSMQLWEGLEQDINFNAMVSQRGVLNLYHSDGQRDAYARRGNAMRLADVDAELLDAAAVRTMVPGLDMDNARFPVKGGLLQRRGGTVRHDAVAWGYARAADALGVDIVQGCEVTGFLVENGRCVGVETPLGDIRAGAVGLATAGHSSVMAEKAGFQLPIRSYSLQAMVSEPVKPCLDTVVLYLGTGTYLFQSDKGEIVFGGGEFERLAFAIVAPVAAIGSGAQRGEFDDLVHGLEQFAVVTDHDRPAMPARQKRNDRLPALPVEIVGGFIEQDEVGLGKDQGGEHGAGALAAREGVERRVGLRREAHLRQGGLDPGFDRPVCLGKVFGGGLPGFGTGDQGQLIAHAEEIGDCLARPGLQRLAQDADRAIGRHRAGLRWHFTGNQAQHRRLADAVAADKSGADCGKGEVEAGKEGAALRRGPTERGERDMCRHGSSSA